ADHCSKRCRPKIGAARANVAAPPPGSGSTDELAGATIRASGAGHGRAPLARSPTLNMQPVVWITALAAIALVLVTGSVTWALQRRRRRPVPLPSEWALSARPVFNTDERRVYRLLREALPHHVLLSKLPLVRFCQPDDPNEVHYWYGLLGAIH